MGLQSESGVTQIIHNNYIINGGSFHGWQMDKRRVT
jgi:hypothetical protein